MNTQQAQDLVGQVMYLDPDYVPSDTPATYMLIKVTEEEKDNLTFHSVIIDPEMPDSGGADEYMALNPNQRLTLEIADLNNRIVQHIASIVTHAPFDEEVWEKLDYNKARMCRYIRYAAQKAASHILEETANGQK